MRTQRTLVMLLGAVIAAASVPAGSQEAEGTAPAPRTPSASREARKFLAPPDQVVAIRAARLFDSRSGKMLANPVIIVRGERIAEVGAGLPVPAGATMIDLGSATVLPGMIDGHVHLNLNQPNSPAKRTLIALANAQVDLEAGFTTVLDMDSRGGFNTVEIRDAINSGMFLGPRMQVVGQSINQRATNYHADLQSLRYYEGFTENKNTNSPWLARAAVREAKLHGVDWIKIYTTQDFVGPVHMWRPDATLVNGPSLTLEEGEAIVAQSHLRGLKGDCDPAGGRNSRLKLMEQAFKRALAAGVTIVFGSGATSATIPHGRQADQFRYFVKWGMTPAQALQPAYLPAARMLNYGWESQIGSIEKGKFADIIAVAGNPLDDVAEMERVKFVMKGGLVVRNELSAR